MNPYESPQVTTDVIPSRGDVPKGRTQWPLWRIALLTASLVAVADTIGWEVMEWHDRDSNGRPVQNVLFLANLPGLPLFLMVVDSLPKPYKPGGFRIHWIAGLISCSLGWMLVVVSGVALWRFAVRFMRHNRRRPVPPYPASGAPDF